MKRANQALEPTTLAVMPCAPSSTSHASQGRGSSLTLGKMIIDILRGRNVTCYYDVPDHCVRLEYGRYYEDQDEAEFFGDHIAEGLPSGFMFAGIVDYSSSNQDNLQVGIVGRVDVHNGRCSVELVDVDLVTSAEVSFSFSTVQELKSRKESTDA